MRFKTEAEFIKHYGKDWRSRGHTWVPEMNNLFGVRLTKSQIRSAQNLINEDSYFKLKTKHNNWSIQSWMLIDDRDLKSSIKIYLDNNKISYEAAAVYILELIHEEGETL